jgi:hypothetical protein
MATAAGDFKTPMSKELLTAMTAVRERFDAQEKRIAALEASRDKEAFNTTLKSQAAQQQAQHPYLGAGQPANLPNEQNLYAPLRSDTKPLIDLAAFARRLLNPDDLAHAVTHEVRNAARRALGMPEVREYDL